VLAGFGFEGRVCDGQPGRATRSASARAHRDAARRSVDEIAELGGALTRQRGPSAVDHRRRRGWVLSPTSPSSKRVSNICSGRISTSHPCRFDAFGLPSLAGDPMVRVGPTGSGHGRPDRRRNLGDGGRLGRLARTVRDNRIPLELCPRRTCRLERGVDAEHPIGRAQGSAVASRVNTAQKKNHPLDGAVRPCLGESGCWRRFGRLAGTAGVDHQRDEEVSHPVLPSGLALINDESHKPAYAES